MTRIVLLYLLLPFSLYSQSIPDSHFFPTHIDSIRFRVEKNRTKEMTLPNQPEVYELMGTLRLNQKDTKKIHHLFQKKSSYTRGRALLTHHNLVFSFFGGGQLQLTTHISTLTKNIDHYKGDASEFHGKISKRLDKALVKLLRRLGFYEAVNEIGDFG